MLDVSCQRFRVTQKGTDRQRVFFLNRDREMYLRLLSRNLAGARVGRARLRGMSYHLNPFWTVEEPGSSAAAFVFWHWPALLRGNTGLLP